MKKLILFYILLLLVAFAPVRNSFAVTEAEAAIGHETTEIDRYDLSGMTENEREWFATFLDGTFFTEGWEQISSDILKNTMPHEREQKKLMLHALGYKIGREWCKGNDVRKIDNSMLRKWGNELKVAAEETPKLLTEVLLRIDKEVDTCLVD